MTSVDAKAETEHRTGGAFRGKSIPIAVNAAEEFGVQSVVKVRGDVEVLVEKSLLFGRAGPLDDISAGWHVITRCGLTDGFAEGGAEIQVFVDIVVAEVPGDVFAWRLGAPDLERSLDGKARDSGAGRAS